MATPPRPLPLMYLVAVVRHWKALVTGSVPVALVTVLKLCFPGEEHVWNQTVSAWVAGSVVAVSLVVAQYLPLCQYG
jgi:hypothetical protein